jgi:hypothetical protein
VSLQLHAALIQLKESSIKTQYAHAADIACANDQIADLGYLAGTLRKALKHKVYGDSTVIRY